MTTAIDHSAMKLGKLAPVHDKRALLFADYRATDWSVPMRCTWPRAPQTYGLMGNDSVGDCAEAMAGHMVQVWTAEDSKRATIVPDAAILDAYSQVAGYVVGDPSTDNGTVMSDLLHFWRHNGIAGHRIEAYCSLEPSNDRHIREAVYLFGGVAVGLALPVSAQRQRVWSVPPGGPVGDGAVGSWGGHAVPIVGYDSQGVTLITWGALKHATWSFLHAYCDEAYACLSPDWLGQDGVAPSHFDAAALRADLKAL